VPLRFDQIEIRQDAIETLPSGAIRIPATISRSGVFTYRQDGKLVREYRPPSEVLHADSVNSFADAPVTIGHPGLVTISTLRRDAVGHVSSPVAKENAVDGHVVIDDPTTIARIKAGQLRSLSPGYKLDVLDTPGTTPSGEPYDRLQTKIVNNHLALLPPGANRQGASVSLRLDSAGDEIAEDIQDPPMKITIRCDGKDHEVEAGSPEHIRLQARADAEKDALAAREKSRADTAETALAAANKELETFRNAKKAADRSALETRARKLLGPDVKFDGKTDREVQVLAIQKGCPDFKSDGLGDEYVAARFDFAFEKPPTTRQDDMINDLNRAQGEKPKTPDDATKAAEKERQDSAELWKRPLAVTR
jgi:hypothetical protein